MADSNFSASMSLLLTVVQSRALPLLFACLLPATGLLGGCDKLNSANFNLNVNGKKVQVKGLKGLKDLATGKTKLGEGNSNGGASEAEAQARANGGTLQDFRRAAKPDVVPAAATLDLNPLGRRRPRKAARALIGTTFVCDMVGIINREDVGDDDTKAALKLVKDVKIGKLYSRLYCRKDAKSKKGVAVYSFLPAEFSRSIDWLRMGGKANVKLLGHAGGNWIGLVQGLVATPGSAK